MWISSCPCIICWLFFLHSIVLAPLLKINWSSIWGFISILSILFYFFICLSLCIYHTILITVALWWDLILKLRSVSPPALLFLKTVLTILDPLQFWMNFRFDFSIYAKKPARSLKRILKSIQYNACTKSLGQYEWYCDINNIVFQSINIGFIFLYLYLFRFLKCLSTMFLAFSIKFLYFC